MIDAQNTRTSRAIFDWSSLKSHFWLLLLFFFYNYFSHFFPKMRLMLIPTYDIEYILLTAIAPVIEYCLSGKTTPLDRVTVVLTSCLWEDMKTVGVSWYPVQFFQSPRSKTENVNYSSTHLFAGCCSCKMPKFSLKSWFKKFHKVSIHVIADA